MTVNKERIELLCRELESTKVQQCAGNLRKTPYAMDEQGAIIRRLPEMMCVWGIATELALQHGVETQIHPWCSSIPQPEIVGWFFGPGVSYTDVEIEHHPVGRIEPFIGSIMDWNDDYNVSFWDMAQGLRAKYLKDEDA